MDEVGRTVERIDVPDEPAPVRRLVPRPLLADDRDPRRERGEPRDEELLAGAVELRDEIVAALLVGARAAPSVEAIVEAIAAEAQPGDTVALLSNGAFGGIYDKLREALS